MIFCSWQALVFACHGHRNHVRFEYYTREKVGAPRNKYKGSWFHTLNEHGYTVIGMDYQGHGISDGVVNAMRGYFESYEALVNDYLQVSLSL